MNVVKPNALHYGQVWRSSSNRFYWVMTMTNAHPEVWMAMDVENGTIRHFNAKTLVDRDFPKNKLTRIYGQIRTPTVVPNELALGYQKGVNTPIIARLNRGLLRTFSGKLIKEAEVSDAPVPVPNKAPTRITYQRDLRWEQARNPNADPLGQDLNLSEGQEVRLWDTSYALVIGVYPNNPWKYHVRNPGSRSVLTFRADGTGIGGRPGIVTVYPRTVHG